MTASYQSLLSEASSIKKYYDKIAELTGSNFNVFEILSLGSSEVRLHSALLRNLLDVNGTHGMGSVFLQKFIEVVFEHEAESKKAIDLKGFNLDFDIESSSAKSEYYIGSISQDNETGGFIDILIEDSKGCAIIIENKIYAGDQPKQLIRYNNFGEKKYNGEKKDNFSLFYLTLDGSKASKDSAGNINYHCISYSKDIIKWLELCLKEASQKPLVRETIQQYINIIKQLTNQTISAEMENELKKLLKKNKDYFLLVNDLKTAYDNINKELEVTFLEKLKGKFESKILGKIKDEKIDLKLEIGEDGQGFYYGCHAFIHNEETLFQEDQTKLDELADKIRKGNDIYVREGWWLVWRYAEREKRWKFTELSVEKKSELLDDDKMDEFILGFEKEIQNFVLLIKKTYID